MAYAVHALAHVEHLLKIMWTRHARAGLGVVLIVAAGASAAGAQSAHPLAIRGHEQLLQLYGPPTGDPVLVSSGDGGWMHLGPHVAELLAARGFFVVGFDAKAYLAGFTTGQSTLRPSEEPADYRTLATFASAATGRKPILVGVSEGAGLSVLAATDPETKAVVAGVIGLGLPEVNELGWRWKDSLIYLTHRPPNEPAVSAAAMVAAVAPLPLALVQSTHDEFVPLADTHRIFARASSPKRLWVVEATNHRFSNNLPEFDARLMEAIDWVRRNQPR
jgi:alpha-beta hydrolase superfamily lysophospholipase